MKITETKLREMINEELSEYLKEVALCHDPETGYFDSCDSGNVYSLSKKGAKSGGVDSKYVQRGTLTKSKPRGDVPVVKALFGLNSKNKSGGRIKIPSGKKITPKKSVSQYPRPYHQTRKKVLREVSQAMASWLSAQEHDYEDDTMNEASECSEIKKKAYQSGLNASLNFIRQYEMAQKGD